MFDFVRNHSRVLFFVMVLLIFPSFVFFGVQGYSQFKDASGATPAGRFIAEHGVNANGEDLRMLVRRQSRPFVTSTIIGASTMAQLKVDIDAFQMEWTSDIEKAVEALHYAQPNPCP